MKKFPNNLFPYIYPATKSDLVFLLKLLNPVLELGYFSPKILNDLGVLCNMEIDVEDVLLEAYFDLLGSIGILQRVECVLKLNCKGSPQRKKCVFQDIGLKGGGVPILKPYFFYIRN